MFNTRKFFKSLSMAGAMALLAAAHSALGKQQVGKAEMVYKNGFVYTADGPRSRAQAFAVRDGKFLAVGSNDDMKAVTGSDTKVIDLKGQMVMPGLIDTHIHAVRGALTSLGVVFDPTASVDGIKAAVKKYIADQKLKKGDWVEGAKWGVDYKKLNAKMLDQVAPDNPVLLHDWTNHLAWVNSAALKAAKISKDSPDPEGGVIDRDSAGNPTGTLHDKALAEKIKKTAKPPEKRLGTATYWQSISDLSNLHYRFKSAAAPSDVYVNLSEIDFSKNEGVRTIHMLDEHAQRGQFGNLIHDFERIRGYIYDEDPD